jgi:hypothetical protein
VADKHPYMSGSGGLVAAVNQLRKAFPTDVSADTLKKLGIAPNNETYVINILRFVGVIDADGKRTKEAQAAFTKHEDAEFNKAFSGLVQAAYKDLFDLYGADTWSLPTAKLISFFRGTDHTSAIVGQRQAATFHTLAALSGHAEVPPAPKAAGASKGQAKKTKEPAAKKKKPEPAAADAMIAKMESSQGNGNGHVGLTVRIEINLPAAGDQETYDRIFKSIRENLLRAQ